MSVAHVTPLGIGELSRRTGVPVRTIRFYCDEGLLEPLRSEGGHRRFGLDAPERLRTVRRLRSLGMGLAAIRAVLAGEDDLGEAIARERASVDAELSVLAWRSAALRAAEQGDPAGRAARLDLLAAVADGPAAHAVLTGFWRSQAVALEKGPFLDAFLEMAAPSPPIMSRAWSGTGRSPRPSPAVRMWSAGRTGGCSVPLTWTYVPDQGLGGGSGITRGATPLR